METHEELLKQYNSGMSIAELARKNKIGSYAMKSKLIASGAVIRTRNQQNKFNPQNQRKFHIDDTYFHQESSNMAYLLGLYASDGNVSKKDNTISLILSNVDKDFLSMVAKELKFTGNIKEYENSKGFRNVRLIFTSLPIKEKFQEYGIIPNKTYNFSFPMQLNKKYWIDFIRGYFDGDGSICKSGQSIRWTIGSHGKNILATIIDFFFEEYQISKVKIYQRKDGFYYFQYSTNATKQIYKILYTQDSLYLPRKKEKFESLL